MADRPSRRRESKDKRRSQSPTGDQQRYRRRSPSHTTSYQRRTAIAPVMDGEQAGKSEVTEALQWARKHAAGIEAARRDATPEQVRREESQASQHREDELLGWNDPFARSHDTGERRDKRAQRALDDETIGEEEPKSGTEQNELRGLFEGWSGLGDDPNKERPKRDSSLAHSSRHQRHTAAATEGSFRRARIYGF